MEKLKYLILVFLPFAFTNVKAQDHSHPLQREWMLVSFTGYKKDFLMRAKTSLKFENLKSAQAKAGCNNMNFRIKAIKNKKIAFGGGTSTMMYCEGYMKLEEEFAKSLLQVCRYEIQGHFLTLSDKKGHQMKFVAADWD